jgi:hypothetical protein
MLDVQNMEGIMKALGFRSGLLAAFTAIPLAIGAGPAHAGATSSRSASCAFNADQSGYCSGSLNAFRNSPDATAYLILQSYVDSNGGISRYVQATWNNTLKFISVSGTALNALFDMAATTVNPNANFYVHWNTSGLADAIQIFNDSHAY